MGVRDEGGVEVRSETSIEDRTVVAGLRDGDSVRRVLRKAWCLKALNQRRRVYFLGLLSSGVGGLEAELMGERLAFVIVSALWWAFICVW